jgi:hypothetical protein
MPSPDQEHKPEATSLDAERARLRSAGYTDAEVSQILIARVSQQPAGTGQGALSNVLSSIVAVAGHARAIIPTFRKDVETMFDGGAAASTRAGATASLAVKAVVILVLGYAAWQEWRIHIAYNPELTRQQLLKATADTLIAQGQSAKAAPLHFGDTYPPAATNAPPATAETEGQKCLRKYHDSLEQRGWNFAEDSNPADFADTPENAQRCFDESKKTCQAKLNGKLITAEQLQNCLANYFSPQRDWHSG